MIARFGREHVDDVAQLHAQSLTGLLTALGPTAIRAFYMGCVTTPSVIGFVFLEKGKVRGFVLGSSRPNGFRMAVSRENPIGTYAGILAGIFRRPSTFVSLVKSFRGPDEGSYDMTIPELTYLAVSGDMRGSGIGRQLVDAFTNAVRDSGARAYELSVDEDNQPAISFYERLGFVQCSRYREFGVMHRRYRFRTA